MDQFPSLVGLMWDVEKTIIFPPALNQLSVSGRENRVALAAFPKYQFSLKYSVLRDTPNVASPTSPFDELKKLGGFFLKQLGSVHAFLYSDPSDSAVTDMQFGTGNGTTVAFQLIRSYGAGGFTFAEPVQNLNGAVTNIKDNGGVVGGGNYSVSATGLVTFNTPPVAGHVLTWTGSYFYRVRFLLDSQGFNQFMQNLWEAKKIGFIGALGNKV